MEWRSQLCKHSLPQSQGRKEKCQRRELGKTAKEQSLPEENMELRPNDCTKETGSKIQPWSGQRTPPCFGVTTTKEERDINAAVSWDCSMDGLGGAFCHSINPLKEQDSGIREQPKYPPRTPSSESFLYVVSRCHVCRTPEAHRIGGKTEQWFQGRAPFQKQNRQEDNVNGESHAGKYRFGWRVLYLAFSRDAFCIRGTIRLSSLRWANRFPFMTACRTKGGDPELPPQTWDRTPFSTLSSPS